MVTDNEKLCTAIFNNSTITNINWAGVGAALGGLKPNSAQKRWSRFKNTSSAENSSTEQPGKATKNGAKGIKKRDMAEMNGGEEEVARKLPARKARAKKVKLHTPSSEEEENGEWAVKGEEKMVEDEGFVGYEDEEA